MIKPILLTAQDEDDVRGIVTMGIAAWNCGIIKQTQGEEELQKTLRAFKVKKYSNERKLLEEYIKIKCTQYGQYNDFIADSQLSIEPNGGMNLSVYTRVTDEIAKRLSN